MLPQDVTEIAAYTQEGQRDIERPSGVPGMEDSHGAQVQSEKVKFPQHLGLVSPVHPFAVQRDTRYSRSVLGSHR